MFHQPAFTAHPRRSALRTARTTTAAALATLALAACGSIPVSSLWQLRRLNLETLDPAALRAAVVHAPALQLDSHALVLTVSVSRKVRQPNGGAATERLEEKLPLQELRSAAERSPLAAYDGPQAMVQVWRIDPAALPRLQALRATALAWKGTDDGKRELALGLELAGCQRSGLRNREVSTLIRFTAPGDYLPIVRNRDVAELLPAEELKKRFPDCAAG